MLSALLRSGREPCGYFVEISVQQQQIISLFLCEIVMSIVMVDIVAVKGKKHKGKNKVS